MKRFMKNFFFIKLLTLILWTTIPIFGQQIKIGKILQLSVTGNSTSDVNVIKMSSGLKENAEIGWEEIQQAIKQLWALGIFSDIRIILDQRTQDGLYIRIQVEEYPRMDKVVINGNKKIKREDIEQELGFFRGQVIGQSQIADAKKRILNKYVEKGYTLAKIKMESAPSEKEGRVVLTVDIHEGKKVQIKKIQIFGNMVFDDSKLRKQMKKTKEDRWWRGADFNREGYEEDRNKILEFYQNNGYRDTEIDKDSLYFDKEKKDMFIDIWINEGKCYYFGYITWEGNTLFSEKHLLSLLEFKEGDIFSQEKFIKSIGEKINGAYFDLGYIYAQAIPRETLQGQDTLNIHFLIDEGKPVTIRKIIITDNTRTKERVIRREIRIRPGDVFSRDLLIRSARDLMMLNYFANVVPDVVQFDTEQREQIDLTFEVEEKSTDTANMSAGWSELDRLVGSIGLSMNNLFGNGQILSLEWYFAAHYRSFSLGFTEPWLMNTPTLIGTRFFDIKRDPYYIGYSQRKQGFSIMFGRRFSWPDNYFRGDWSYTLYEENLGDFAEYISNLVREEDYPITHSGITQTIKRNSLDQPEFPTRGSLISLTTEIAGGPIGGNVGYHKHHFSAECFFPVIPSKLIFLSRVQGGLIDELTKSGRIPYLEHFFIGGSGLSQSIALRGYDDPLTGGSYRHDGGRTLLKTTIELRFPIISNPTMYGLFFAEAGNTWTDMVHTDPFNLRRSVGIGARLFMPMVGMIGFDYGYGFDQVNQYGEISGAWKPHFIFGRSF